MILIVIMLFLFVIEPSFAEIVLPKSIHGKYTIKSSEEIYLIKNDLTVEPDGILIIEPGVKIKIAADKSIHVYGQFRALGGTKSIWISEELTGQPWNGIIFFPGSKNNIFQRVIMDNGVIYADESEIEFRSSAFRNNFKDLELPFIYIKSSKVLMDDCFVHSGKKEDGLVIEGGENIIVRNSSFSNCSDPLEYSFVKGGLIENNKIQIVNDDGIDLNACEDILIRNNILFKGVDNGISIGNSHEKSSKNITVERNVITEFRTAVSVKGGSDVAINHCTFAYDSLVFEGWQKEAGTGGGNFQIRNSIMANYHYLKDIDKYSSITFEYSLSDEDSLEGNNNITTDPKFYDVDYYMPLSYNSPCIDAADPNSPLDPDGTRADIGATYFDQRPPKIVINEINYNSGQIFDSGDWIEIINIGDDYEFMENSYITLNDDTIYIFDDNVELVKNDMFVIANDTNKFYEYYEPCIYPRDIVIFDVDLPKQGNLKLYDSTGRLVDEVNYSNVSPWDDGADGTGHSLELINPVYDNSLPENWKASIVEGTPCEKNSVFSDTTTDSVNGNGLHYNEMIVYPNPGGRVFYIKVDNLNGNQFNVRMYDLLGRKINIETKILGNDNKIIQVRFIDYVNFGNYLISLSSENFNRIVIYNYSE